MNEELTLEHIRHAVELIDKNEWHCPKCGTKRELMVLGICEEKYLPLFCKCEAERLSKTPFVQNQLNLIKQLFK